MAHPYKDKATTDRDRAKHRDLGGRGVAGLISGGGQNIPSAMRDMASQVSKFGNDPGAYLSALRARPNIMRGQRPDINSMRMQRPAMPQTPMPQIPNMPGGMPQQAMPVQDGSVHGGVMKRGGRAGRKK